MLHGDLWKHGSSFLKELHPYVSIWDVGGKFLDELLSSRECLPGFFLMSLRLIELTKGTTNAPEPWSQPLGTRGCLCIF